MKEAHANKVSQSALARKLKISRQRVHSMVNEGLITPDAKGLIDFDDALQAIAENRDPGKGGKQTPVEGTFYEHRTRKEAALARLREIEASEKEGSLVNAEELRLNLAKLFVDVKTQIRAIAPKVTQEIAHLKISKTGRELTTAIEGLLRLEHDAALLQLSQWRPQSGGKNLSKKEGLK